MSLLQDFLKHITHRQLLKNDGRYLLAVSGGVDSMVLLELMHGAGFYFEVAHANFQLRGAASDADEALVRTVCKEKNIPFHSIQFDTKAYMDSHKQGVQEAARNLRYHWMLELLQNQGLHHIVTAHHQDDNIETVTMHFFKGTGWAGLSGMKEKDGGINGKLIRPLLVFGKQELLQFASTHQLKWRDDASNESIQYTRNFFRNKCLPLVQQKIPEVRANLIDNLSRFNDMRDLIDEVVQDKLKKLVVHKGEGQQVPVLLLQKCKGISTILFYWLRAFGFHAGQSGEAMKLLNAETGRFIESASHRLFKNRQWLLLVPKPAAMGTLVVIDEGQSSVDFDNRAMRINVGNGSPVPTPEAEIALIDAVDISFPLILRPWKTGDYFYPLGMNKKKKLSRFFIDNKLSIAAKEKVWVLESDKKIIWVVGYRIDNRFKLKPTTNQWIRFELLPSK